MSISSISKFDQNENCIIVNIEEKTTDIAERGGETT